ncbi:predicted D-lactate dehydrogenase [Vibrio variabilis]|uniref:Predicted D-lactate dehydrogenase n=1 Tax=Vibrio variabilis TaxID=990271 RepID=A0ABQ0JH25_9VIBR|nr:predicted D-lactate dehydrogenase [Vibrio variabilis]
MNTQPNAFDQRSLGEVTMSLIEKAGYSLIAPKSLSDQCCGMPYDSKGMTDIATQKSEQLEQALWEASEQGKYPVLMDTSPCAKRSIEQFTKPITIVEPVKFVSNYLIDELELTPVEETVMLHVTCSSRRMGLESTMLQLAKACATKVVLPEHIQCCGWAGRQRLHYPRT